MVEYREVGRINKKERKGKEYTTSKSLVKKKKYY